MRADGEFVCEPRKKGFRKGKCMKKNEWRNNNVNYNNRKNPGKRV